MPRISAESFRFLRELAANNERVWFEANRERYIEHVREPSRQLVRDLSPLLQAISPHYRGDDRLVGGSLFRIHRDVRFAKNKAPYKPWAGARFWHDVGGRSASPVFYLHLAPDDVFVGAGIWRPDAPLLKRIRNFLHHNPRAWQALFADEAFAAVFTPGGEVLARMPRGFSEDDPVAADLKRKDFVVSSPLSEDDALAPDFAERVAGRFRLAARYVDYLCAALDLEF